MTAKIFRAPLSRAAVLAACVLSGSWGAVQAATPTGEVPSVVVAYGDLDLGSPDGVHMLYNRIAAAAGHVCPFQDAMDPEHVSQFKSCRNAAITRAINEVKGPQLAALRAEHAKHG